MKLGLIARSPSGRVMTADGKAQLRETYGDPRLSQLMEPAVGASAKTDWTSWSEPRRGRLFRAVLSALQIGIGSQDSGALSPYPSRRGPSASWRTSAAPKSCTSVPAWAPDGALPNGIGPIGLAGPENTTLYFPLSP